MVKALHKQLKKLEKLLYKELNSGMREKIRNQCLAIFNHCDQLLSKFEFSEKNKELLERIKKGMNNIEQVVMLDEFNRIKTNNDLVIPFIKDIEEMAKELEIQLDNLE